MVAKPATYFNLLVISYNLAKILMVAKHQKGEVIENLRYNLAKILMVAKR